MATKRKSQKSSAHKVFNRKNQSPWSWATLFIFLGLVAVIFLSVIAVRMPTRLTNFAACNDSGCQNVKNGSLWQITECSSTDPNGDQQLCNTAGRIGTCRLQKYCCPASGAQWTTDMSACPVATATPVPTAYQPPTPYPTYTPYPTQKPYATNPPLPTSTRAPTSRPLPTSTRRPTSTIRPTNTPSPTRTPLLSEVCGKSCTSDADCQLGLGCSTIFGTLHACRNKSCPDNAGCSCDSGNGSLQFATPTPGPGSGELRILSVSLNTFTDRKQQTNSQPTISGTSEPDAKITVTIYPDGVGGEVYADKNGKWSFRPTKKLSAGQKTLLVVATKVGAQGQVSQPFTVVGGGGINVGTILLLMVVVALGFGVYVFIKSNQ
jgi:hypothetical protein